MLNFSSVQNAWKAAQVDADDEAKAVIGRRNMVGIATSGQLRMSCLHRALVPGTGYGCDRPGPWVAIMRLNPDAATLVTGTMSTQI